MAIGTDQALETPAVLLTGASSQVGVFLIPRLLREGFRVFAVSRKGKPQAYPDFERVEWLSESDALQVSAGCRYLLSAGPLELAQNFLGNASQLQAAVVFSSSSVETKQKSGDPVERNQVEGMLTIETQLQRTADNDDIKLVILRPTLIYGCGMDTNISRLARWIRRFGFMPVNGKASGLRQPVHADDLAKLAITAMLSNEVLPQVLPACGGSTLSYSEMVARIFAALDKPVRLVHLPQWLFVLLARAAGVFNITAGINGEMIKRQAVDLVFDDQQTKKLLNYRPRAFAPVEADFSLPEFRQP